MVISEKYNFFHCLAVSLIKPLALYIAFCRNFKNIVQIRRNITTKNQIGHIY